MKKLLVIEDDRVIGRVYACRFELEGFVVRLVEDGVAGLAVIPEFKPDAILLDMMLPKVSGFEILRRLRADPSTRELPVVVFSNAYLSGVQKDAMELGATVCLHKGSTSPKQVVGVLNKVFEAAARAREAAVDETEGGVADSARVSEGLSVKALQDEFYASAPGRIACLRKEARQILASSASPAKNTRMTGLRRELGLLASNATLLDLETFSRVAEAMEALAAELHESPKSVNASAERTVLQGIDFLEQLLSPELLNSPVDYPKTPQILVVDDEAISRRAIMRSLQKGRLPCTDCEDPVEALEWLPRQAFDLVILDVEMPVMKGFELCRQMRKLPGYAQVPVIFVTALSGFESRKSAAMSGGNDFIAKPFLFLELTVKALIHLVRIRVEMATTKSPLFIAGA